ncbi:hypothetical protein B0J18DRAFT_162192 [Chaetomium sp. MPI-SDFR-AT-0129]|nr:hypothetical protein B0J18DRAFT_162192 [Chaetomium sp. MPI-SDFR-AT-0129]
MALPEWALSLLHPWQFMLISLSFLPATLRSESLSTILFHPSRLRSAWFGRFWAFVAPNVRAHAEPHVVPLLQGRVSMWVSLFTPRFLNPGASQATPPITKIYGIEPNVGVHPLLRAQIAAAGLDTPNPANNNSTYEILPVGIESLASSGRVTPESVDCIVTVLCLCSIPQPRENIAQLYGYLKPGGRWYVYEHVKCFREQGWGMRAYQAFLNLFWPQFIGGCEMCRDTNTYLKEAGPWSNVDVHRMDDELWCYTMPHIIGVLTK